MCEGESATRCSTAGPQFEATAGQGSQGQDSRRQDSRRQDS